MNKCNIHNWKIVSVWGVNTFFMRRECSKCKTRQDATINPWEWEQASEYELSYQARGFKIQNKKTP